MAEQEQDNQLTMPMIQRRRDALEASVRLQHEVMNEMQALKDALDEKTSQLRAANTEIDQLQLNLTDARTRIALLESQRDHVTARNMRLLTWFEHIEHITAQYHDSEERHSRASTVANLANRR